MFQRLAIPLFILVIGFFEFTIARTSDELRVTLPNGNKLIGRALRSHGGRSIKAFLGVPYAKPPVGHLRFQVNTFLSTKIKFDHFFTSFYHFRIFEFNEFFAFVLWFIFGDS